jgi:small GTP-binding protein
VIGQSGAGKTTLLLRFLEDTFADKAPGTVATIGMDVVTKDVLYEKTKFRLEVWDTAGQERYRTIVKNYFSLSKVACIVFDISDEKSLD